jgi:subtilisin family serine protease
VDYAWSKGALLFAAAMNYSFFCPCYSAACNHAPAVSTTYNNHQLAGFSITATGSRSRSPDHFVLTTALGGGYGAWQGTSFASPVAAGVAALVLAVNPGLTPSALVSVLERSAALTAARSAGDA